MTRVGEAVEPDRSVAKYHDAKYAVYRRMIDDHLAYRTMMSD